MRSALFVDFDNVYSGLRTLDPAIADRFARQPSRWVHWLLADLELPEQTQQTARRRLLVRRVYLNPQVYQGYRVGFNHAGFEIVDCPALTAQGKTSTDIHMVLDMVDLLQHEVHYDEFIVFSADADFTPVLRKLRRWDRRTTVLAVGFPSAAYRASADLLIDTDDFVHAALGMVDADDAASLAVPTNGNPSTGSSSGPGEPPVPVAANGLGPQAAGAAQGFSVHLAAEYLRAEVARSEQAVPCARLASQLQVMFPGLAPGWAGHGGFRRFAEGLPLAPLLLDWRDSGGHLYDPARHLLPTPNFEPANLELAWGLDRATFGLLRQVHETTGVPLISPREFRGLLEAAVADVALQAFQLSETGKRVRDRCREAGLGLSREDVNWVLRGLAGVHAFGQGQDDVPNLSYRLVGHLINLCRREQMVLEDGAPAVLQRWVSGKSAEAGA